MVFGKHVNKYYLKYAIWLLLGLLSLIMVDYFQLMIPSFYRMVINGVNTGEVEIGSSSFAFDMDFLLDKICMPMLFIILLIVVGRFLWRICLFGAGIKVERDLRNAMFDHAKDLSREYYHVNKVGNLMSLFTNDLDTIQECFGVGFLTLFDAIILGSMSIVKMWKMDVLLTVLALIPMAFLIAASILVGKYMMKKWEIRQEAFSALSDFSQESFSGIAVVKAFVKEAKELLAFEKLNRKNEDANVTFTHYSVLLKILVTFFIESVICIILGYGGYLVYLGKFNAGQLVEFIGYFTAIVWPIMAVSEFIDLTSRGSASLKRISALLDSRIDVTDREGVCALENVRGEIEFRGLSFRYPYADRYSLHNVSFKIQAGENIGLVGKTGSGKSTLVDLILRMYNVNNGTLFIDGHDVNTVPIKDVRGACAYVPQDNFLFSDTIANNISFELEGANDSDIENAAVLACIDENVKEFTHGYNTLLGERGVTVSGGQKQRISIARALIKNSPILILDDSLSAVDTKTEKAIFENLKSARQGKTTILIAHRISTVKQMDKVLFIDEGTIKDFGTHDELYERCEEYRKTVDLQKLEDEGGNS